MNLSKLKIAGYVVLWVAVVLGLSVGLERFRGIPNAIKFGVVMFLSTLALYPIEKQNQRGRVLTFSRWALGMLVASAATAAISYIVELF